jgi:hypothetical protein
MALCLATSLIERGGFDARDQMERYLRWLDFGYFSSIGSFSFEDEIPSGSGMAYPIIKGLSVASPNYSGFRELRRAGFEPGDNLPSPRL